MKALTLTQPWATLIAGGAKTIETRSWSTSYRGPIAIHSAKTWRGVERKLVYQPPFDAALIQIFGIDKTKVNFLWALAMQHLPLGAILATANLIDCRNTELVHESQLTVNERAFGDYTPGRYAWILDDVHRLKDPISCKGALGLWTVPAEIQLLIEQQLKTVRP